jgi:hypothetical protein
MPNQVTREESPPSNRVPVHARTVDVGERWAEPRPSLTLPLHPGWPPHSQWSQAGNEYHVDMYGIGPRSQTWQNGPPIAPQWQDAGIPYNVGRDGPWRGNMHMGIQNAPLGYQMYTEGKMFGYGRVPIGYAGSQGVGSSASPLPPTIPTTLPHTLCLLGVRCEHRSTAKIGNPHPHPTMWRMCIASNHRSPLQQRPYQIWRIVYPYQGPRNR